MTDTHTHLYMPEFDIDGQAVGSYCGQCQAIDRAIEAGVGMMVFPNVDIASIEAMRAVHRLRPQNTAMAMGLHPTEVGASWQDALATVTDELHRHAQDYIAVGEVGIDLYWDKTYADEQMQVLDRQIDEAVNMNLPVIIHCREGLMQTLEVLQGHRKARAVFHSFGGTADDVDAIRKTGDHYFGINGIVTFKNSRLGEVLAAIGLNRILTETDSPYLAPTPYRGKRNESAYIPIIVQSIASHLGASATEVAQVTDLNAQSFFSINNNL